MTQLRDDTAERQLARWTSKSNDEGMMECRAWRGPKGGSGVGSLAAGGRMSILWFAGRWVLVVKVGMCAKAKGLTWHAW